MPYIFNACTCLLLVILVVQKLVNESIAVNVFDSLLSIIMVILLQLYSDELTRSTSLGEDYMIKKNTTIVTLYLQSHSIQIENNYYTVTIFFSFCVSTWNKQKLKYFILGCIIHLSHHQVSKQAHSLDRLTEKNYENWSNYWLGSKTTVSCLLVIWVSKYRIGSILLRVLC